jgi:hypothetical protein
MSIPNIRHKLGDKQLTFHNIFKLLSKNSDQYLLIFIVKTLNSKLSLDKKPLCAFNNSNPYAKDLVCSLPMLDNVMFLSISIVHL